MNEGYEEQCPTCRGTWSGCKRCYGLGYVVYKTSPEERKKQRMARYRKEGPVAAINRAKTYGAIGKWVLENKDWNEFAQSLLNWMETKPLTDKQKSAVERIIA